MDNDKESYSFSDTYKIEHLNNSFSSITFSDNSNHELPIVGCRCNNSYSEIKIQKHYITVNKAVGPDCIRHKMFKSCKDPNAYY